MVGVHSENELSNSSTDVNGRPSVRPTLMPGFMDTLQKLLLLPRDLQATQQEETVLIMLDCNFHIAVITTPFARKNMKMVEMLR